MITCPLYRAGSQASRLARIANSPGFQRRANRHRPILPTPTEIAVERGGSLPLSSEAFPNRIAVKGVVLVIPADNIMYAGGWTLHAKLLHVVPSDKT
ncbi:hypothetical protein D3C85_1339580 [compost metagenome]